MREVRGKGVYIRKDTNYNYKSEHFEFMLGEKIMERGSALGDDMLTLVAEIQNTAFILYPESILSSKTQLQELLMTAAWFMSPTLRANRDNLYFEHFYKVVNCVQRYAGSDAKRSKFYFCNR